MVYFDYCPVLGLKEWEFVATAVDRPKKKRDTS